MKAVLQRVKRASVDVDGKTVDALSTYMENNGMKLYQVMFQKKCSGYLASMAITTANEDATADVIDNFKWID